MRPVLKSYMLDGCVVRHYTHNADITDCNNYSISITLLVACEHKLCILRSVNYVHH